MAQTQNNFMPYPEYNDPNFYKKIYSKKEFFRTKAPPFPPDDKIEKYTADICNPQQFTVQNYQEFVRNFISSATNYNGKLLFWGVGTGKTCGAIQIAEGLKDMVKKLDKHIYILTKKQIMSNFMKELYSKERASKETIPGSMQCTGNAYYIPDMGPGKAELREKMIKDNINKYYTFMGPRRFANYVDNKIKGKKTNSIGQYFSNSVFIIDEAHELTKLDQKSEQLKRKKLTKKNKTYDKSETESDNELDEDEDEDEDKDEDEDEGSDDEERKLKKIKNSEERDDENPSDEKKKRKISERRIIDVFNEIFQDSEGIKLIMLTATPMKDTAKDLTSIIDLLLRNDKRPTLDSPAPKTLIRQYKEFVPVNIGKRKVTYEDLLFKGEADVNEELLKKLTRGYISYVRGENPASFPTVENIKTGERPGLQLYMPKPFLTDDGIEFDQNDYMKHIEVIKCQMSLYQYSNYLNILKKKEPSKIGGKSKHEMKSTIGIQASNIIFPTNKRGIGAYGEAGLIDVIKEKSTEFLFPGRKGVAKNKTIRVYDYKFSPDENDNKSKGLLHVTNIGKYSQKFLTLLNNIINSTGIVYVYTDFVKVGAMLIALMLEQNGYQRFINDRLRALGVSQLWDPKSKSSLSQDEMRCAICGKEKNNHSGHDFKQATYVLFTGTEKYFSQTEIDIVNSKINKDGQIIKVIVGTRVSGVGVDYKMIREVHITDPWHNNTRLYQVIGRAARHCSHINFDNRDDRVVKVFRYCAAPPKEYDDFVTGNNNNYSRMKKFFDIIVPGSERYIPFTYKNLLLETSDEKVYRRIENKDIFVKRLERILKEVATDCALNRNINIFRNDKDYSRACDYMKCDYVCDGFDGKTPPENPKINVDTYNLYFSEPQINRIKQYIISLFKYNYVMKLESIVYETSLKFPGIEHEFIYEAIDRIVGHRPQREPIKFVDRFDRKGYLIFSHPYYVFQPDELLDEKAPLYYKTTPLNIKNGYINIETLKERKIIPKKITIKDVGHVQPNKIMINISRKIDELTRIGDKYTLHYELSRILPEMQASIYETVTPNSRGTFNQTFVENVNDFFIKSRKLYILSTSNKDEIIGHHINNIVRLYDREKGKWINPGDNVTLSKKINQDIAEERALSRMDIEMSNIIGFVIYESGEFKFKIIDLKDEKRKNKKMDVSKIDIKEEISEKTLKRGKLCSNFPITKIKEIMDILKMDENNVPRATLCKPIEIQFRKLDDIDKDRRWFFSEEDFKTFDSNRRSKSTKTKRRKNSKN